MGDLCARGPSDRPGIAEVEETLRLVERQLARVAAWRHQDTTCAARLERIATELEALELEVDAPAPFLPQPEGRAIARLAEELATAEESALEAERLLPGAS
jgi:hypothetical protein